MAGTDLRPRPGLRPLAALGLVVALLAVSCSRTPDDADAASPAPRTPTEVAPAAIDGGGSFTLTADAGSAADGVLTLTGVDDQVLVAHDSRGGDLASMATEDLDGSWDDAFGDAGTNAVLQFQVDGEPRQAVVELTSMDHDPDTDVATHGYRTLHGEIPATFEQPSLIVNQATPDASLVVVNQTGAPVSLVLFWPQEPAFSPPGRDNVDVLPLVWETLELDEGGTRTIRWWVGDGASILLSDFAGHPADAVPARLGERWLAAEGTRTVELRRSPTPARPGTIEVENGPTTRSRAEFWLDGRPAAIARYVTDRGKVTTFQPTGELAVATNPTRLGWGNPIPEEVVRTATAIVGDAPGSVPTSGRIIVTSGPGGLTVRYEPATGG